MFLIFDTETTGLPKNWKAPLSDFDNWPRMVQLAWQCHSIDGKFLFAKNHVIQPEGFSIPENVVEVHGISNEIAKEKGIPLTEALKDFVADVKKSTCIVGHNISFDINIVGAELLRCKMPEIMTTAPQLCTMTESTEFCAIMKNGKPKRPTLTELHTKLFHIPFEEAHNAAADVEATSRCFLELIRVGVLTANSLKISENEIENFKKINTQPFELQGIIYESFKKKINFANINTEDVIPITDIELTPNSKGSFVHLNVHSQYSILEGSATISQIVEISKEEGMSAVALTDRGNMFGVKDFHNKCKEANIKPIIGIEVYVAKRGHQVKEDKQDAAGDQLILLAKNKEGYKNLLKLTSISHIDGFYYKPRIDKKLLEKHKEGLIVTSSGLRGEIAQHIINGNFEKAEETVLWFKKIFQDDFYLEVVRHENDDPRLRIEVWEKQQKINKVILKLAKNHTIKVVATNDVHFAEKQDGEAHDLLICLNTGRDFSDPTRMRYTKQEWFKSTSEMYEIFKDIPAVLLNTIEIAEKVEYYELDSKPLMPPFAIPSSFTTLAEMKEKNGEKDLLNEFGKEAFERLGGYEKTLQIKLESDYLKKLTYEGAHKNYGENLPNEVIERIDFELDTIKKMGFPGYFLITQDFINEGRKMGVLVGPGRGSAAGSVVAYCVGITSIDPLKYNLLFERFLNPDRISMPDVDIDFDDDGRQIVLDWVTQKYGKEKVAHICTFGTMAAKSALKDVARVLNLPLQEAIRITKEFPERGDLKRAYQRILKLENETGSIEKAIDKIKQQKAVAEKNEKEKDVKQCEVDLFIADEIIRAREENNDIALKTLEYACILEGSIRHTGVHACGILISPDPLNQHLPLMLTKGEENLNSTQYDGKFVESIGLLKMDFLGLRTLSIFKECLENIKNSKGLEINLDKISFHDSKTYQLFEKGETTAIFQFESAGMKKYLQALKPNRFEDLVAMNALYRPGPMDYIPDFIKRKNNLQKVEYDHPLMEEYLKETFGITVYQEQVMLLSRTLAGFTRGMSDSLRKAMGKKKKAEMDKLKIEFEQGCKNNPEFVKGVEQSNKDIDQLIEKIWTDWEAFASYAFNKSHSVCYADVAYKTAYLKANFPAEFMAANLSRNLSNITEVTKLMEECKRMQQQVFGPDVNLSNKKFTVDKNGDIRFGMAAIKNVGEAAVENIINERKNNGNYKNIYDFVERVDLKAVNKKTLESLAESGAFDTFPEIKCRSQYFEKNSPTNETFIEVLLKYGASFKEDKQSSQATLFDMSTEEFAITKPPIPVADPWSTLEKLNREKELVGIYLSAHPLDEFKIELDNFCNTNLKLLENLEDLKNKELNLGGIITNVKSGISRTGKQFGGFTLEDYTGTHEFIFFGKDYLKYKEFFIEGLSLFIKGKVQQKLWAKEEIKPLEFKILDLYLLKDTKEKLLKSISVTVDIETINTQQIIELEKTVRKHKGKIPFNVVIYDKEKDIYLDMLSRTYRVDVNREMIIFLEQSNTFSFKLN